MKRFIAAAIGIVGLLSVTRAGATAVPRPVPAEVAITFDKPWEGKTSNYVTVFQDGDLFRMYYRGSDEVHAAVVCYAESTDGIHWVRPDLGLFAFNGSKHNNIVYENEQPKAKLTFLHGNHGFYSTIKDGIAQTPVVDQQANFAAFKDTNPRAKPNERYKALIGIPPRALASPDGIHWHDMSSDPVMHGESYDSQNTAIYLPHLGSYVAYVRRNDSGVRQIVMRKSLDFLHWKGGMLLSPAATPARQLYTNAVSQLEGFYVGLPAIFRPTGDDSSIRNGYFNVGLMISKDGIRWRRFHTALVTPKTDKFNLTHGSLISADGLLHTGPDELSIYYVEHAYFPSARLRRATLKEGEFVTFVRNNLP